MSPAGPIEAVEEEIRANLGRVRARIEAAAARAGRDPGDVTLVGASKRQPLERVAAALRAGLGVLGENFVQEARDKRDALLAAIGDAPAPRFHLIGRLQRNKAPLAARLFDCIETVDREAVARALDARAREATRALEVFLQVNVSREPQKAGVLPEDAAALLAACGRLEGLRVVGLMAIPAAADDAEATRPAFAQLRSLRDTLCGEPGGAHLHHLSMGMSGDYEIAIEEGATCVRIGTALFGERAPKEGQA